MHTSNAQREQIAVSDRKGNLYFTDSLTFFVVQQNRTAVL